MTGQPLRVQNHEVGSIRAIPARFAMRSSCAFTRGRSVAAPRRVVHGRTLERCPATQSGTVLVHGLQEISREMAGRGQKRLQRNLDGVHALARCRSMTELVEVQSSLLRDNLEQTVENSRRIAELPIQMADEAARTVTVRAEKAAERVSRAA